MKKRQIFLDGIVSNNAPFMLFLGACPTLATTKTFIGAVGMGLAILVTIILTNVCISAVRKWIPNEIRIPVLIVIIATIVTIVELVMQAYMYDLAQTLGVYLSLIVVNCIILGRAEAFAIKNSVVDSLLDAIGIGVGFTIGLVVLAFSRELLGTGSIVITSLLNGSTLTTLKIFNSKYAISIFVDAPGAFIMFGLLAGLLNFVLIKIKEHKKNKELAAKATEVGA